MVRKAAITLAVAFSAVLAAAATINKRIKGGEDAKEGEFPFIVRLNFPGNGEILCGGSLLDSTTVLTAAHCVVATEAISVRAGSLDKETGGVVAEVKSNLLHPDYNHFKRGNDIAILKLSTPIEESKTISYAKLPAGGSSPVIGSTAVAAGWGLTEDRLTADKLRKVAMSIRAPDECVNFVNRQDPEYMKYQDRKVCAGEGDKDTGSGDSGGPLIDQETGQLIGVTSAGRFYTKVGSYIPFIISGIEPRGVTD
ncbi:Peptidase cysteine/serine, trypsin-like protein [Metarhizium guizhouense ARSEF 977]|uniref:Peptidase cysteine/serine, trypsin-like protein n=1 Tax=Metarhizium guizhouense (strain ARSEF 977) TaxID=1276136 RepID=A0A0B4GWC9_METGA|nr:Peptidase cysteine/serine, trypsin-like protein [Metarhizium guizhouense ARSEF 977]